MTDPAPEEVIAARYPRAVDIERFELSVRCDVCELMNRGPPSRRILNLDGELTANFLICIDGKNVFALCFVDCGILLRGVALPCFDEYLRAERLGDLDGSVGRAGVDDDNLSFAVGDQWLHTFERAGQVCFFVVGDDDHRQDHRLVLPLWLWRGRLAELCSAGTGEGARPHTSWAMHPLPVMATEAVTGGKDIRSLAGGTLTCVGIASYWLEGSILSRQ